MLWITAILILVSSIDDAFVDVYYVIYKIWRKLFISSKYKKFQGQDLLQKQERPFVLLIPAWEEANVILPMLKNTLVSYIYDNYHIFIGCYPNDHDTISEVKKILPFSDKIHLCIMSSHGPTSKADCLNQIYNDIHNFEKQFDTKFTGYVLHDAEDIVHPFELKLYNHLIPRKDMVQIPVIPLERSWYDLTGGHYQDEFAENHGKELVVRESLTGHVPSAGVGTALSRKAISTISNNHTTPPFDTNNLTEDYDLALRLKKEGLKLIFTRFNARPNDIIATREYFPNRLSSVIKQKSRWLMGIVFQGWRNRGWSGSLALKYALFRDRKGILTAQLSILAYFIILNVIIVSLIEWLFPDGYRYPPLVRSGELLEYLLWVNLFFLINRSFHRVYFSYRIYGPLIAFMSIPRQLWGNVLNFLASMRAIYLYSGHLIFNTPLTWDKTDHAFPASTELAPFRRKLGELLVHSKMITHLPLNQALFIQKKTGEKLGQILINEGYITEQQLSDTLKKQVTLNEHQT